MISWQKKFVISDNTHEKPRQKLQMAETSSPQIQALQGGRGGT